MKTLIFEGAKVYFRWNKNGIITDLGWTEADTSKATDVIK